MEEEAQARVTSYLEETFYITSKKNTIYRVRLTEKGLSLNKENNGSTKIELISLCDIIGCRCMRSKKQNAGSCACRASKSQLRLVESNEVTHSFDEYDTSAYLYIYAYTIKKARVKGARRRERTTITLRFRSFDKYEDNLREASRWRLAIKCLISKIPVPKILMSPSHGNLESIISGERDFFSFYIICILFFLFVQYFTKLFFAVDNFYQLFSVLLLSLVIYLFFSRKVVNLLFF